MHLQILHQENERSIRPKHKARPCLFHIKALQIDVCQGDMESAKYWDCM